MPIERFPDFESARRSLVRNRQDPSIPDRIRRILDFSRQLAPHPHPRGIWKFRTIEESNRHREEFVALRVRALREKRGRSEPRQDH